ncbi:MAG TPA: hypothetical protein VKN82_06075 [Desulfohalobiaceae bacterium]|nr:hypothetical protein [Desulfohalobiaceae bacterium]
MIIENLRATAELTLIDKDKLFIFCLTNPIKSMLPQTTNLISLYIAIPVSYIHFQHKKSPAEAGPFSQLSPPGHDKSPPDIGRRAQGADGAAEQDRAGERLFGHRNRGPEIAPLVSDHHPFAPGVQPGGQLTGKQPGLLQGPEAHAGDIAAQGPT